MPLIKPQRSGWLSLSIGPMMIIAMISKMITMAVGGVITVKTIAARDAPISQ